MDRLARLRTRSSAGGPLNASTTSSLAAGYETANDESLTSGSGSMYFSMTEGTGNKSGIGVEEGEDGLVEEEPTLSGTLAASGHSGVDQTLENDFSVEEVSTIRKATIAVASPATVQVAAGMAVKYLGVSSTPAPKTPKSVARKEDLSGFDQLEQTPSIMKKMRDPKTPADSSFGDNPEESKATLDGSGIQEPPPSNKSYGTNVLANFFATLDVNSGTPVPPEIKVSGPEDASVATGTTPGKRDSNSLENFFESLKKNPAPEVPTARPRKSLSVRKSLIPKVAAMAATSKQNRVASPISRNKSQTAGAGAVRLLPEKLREMRKTTHNDQLVQFRQRKSVVPAAAAVGDSAKATGGLRKSMAVATAAAASLKRKSVMPTTTATAKTASVVNGRKSVMPAVPAVKRGVVSATGVPSLSVALKIPAKTTLSKGPDGTNNNGPASSTHHRRTLLGKRPATTLTATASLPEKLTTVTPPQATTSGQPPVAKQQRKSLAAPKEPSPAVRVSPRNKPATAPPPQGSRIRPPSTTTTSAGAGFKKPETFTCDQCQRIFRLRSSFETHVKTVHQSSPSTPSPLTPASPSKGAGDGAKCQYCGKGFAGAKFLANHVVSNCVKIPLLEKRRLLAEGEAERAASVKRSTPESVAAAAAKKRQSVRPMNRSASQTTARSGDEETDTSTCSSGSGGGGGVARKRTATAGKAVTTGSGGISRTPNKELKCHLCARRFLNAVEYALHVQAHKKNATKGGGGGGGGDGEDVENAGKVQLEQTEDVVKLVQKLATLKNRNGVKGPALKSSNSNVGGK